MVDFSLKSSFLVYFIPILLIWIWKQAQRILRRSPALIKALCSEGAIRQGYSWLWIVLRTGPFLATITIIVRKLLLRSLTWTFLWGSKVLYWTPSSVLLTSLSKNRKESYSTKIGIFNLVFELSLLTSHRNSFIPLIFHECSSELFWLLSS